MFGFKRHYRLLSSQAWLCLGFCSAFGIGDQLNVYNSCLRSARPPGFPNFLTDWFRTETPSSCVPRACSAWRTSGLWWCPNFTFALFSDIPHYQAGKEERPGISGWKKAIPGSNCLSTGIVGLVWVEKICSKTSLTGWPGGGLPSTLLLVGASLHTRDRQAS